MTPPPRQAALVVFVGAAVSYCGRLLAGLGTTAILVEPLVGAGERRMPPFAPGPLGAHSSVSFAFNAAGMHSVPIDSTTADGADVLRRTLDVADVVVDALAWEPPSPWVEACADAIAATATPVCRAGPDGRLAGTGADDLLIQAASGQLALSGFLEGEPTPVPSEIARAQTALLAATAVLSMLLAAPDSASSTVRAQAGLALMTLQTANPGFYTWHTTVPKRAGTAGLSGRPHRAKDGFVIITVPAERWTAFIRWLDELGIDRGHLPESLDGQVDTMRAAMARASSCIVELAGRFTKRELYHAAQQRGLLCMPANTLEEVLTDEHLAARGFFVADNQGRADLRSPVTIEPPLWSLEYAAPVLGEYTETFCTTSLGYTRQEVESLLAMGALSCGH
jgi:crotonobetainyl-CoA:carnitine CoA-transferase CaiB-like acyl-CoA transferase